MRTETQTPPGGPRLISGPEVQARLSVSRCTVWRMVRRGDFPAPVRVSPGRVAWSAGDVDAWIAGKIAAARGEA